MLSRIGVLIVLTATLADAADRSLQQNPKLEKYFQDQVSQIEQQESLLNYETLDQWEAARPKLRGQLFDMLGLSPLPERTPLRAQVTGTIEEAEFRVEKIHFQSSPGLYVTGNLYLPKVVEKPLPTILYVCGHARVEKDGVSFGNKTAYHHHGAWFARNGYACLTIDTLQLGEIAGIHHGTYRYDRWWWNSRGYTPAGVEAWNCIRALDYLETRSEVDADRIGVTGRSGGGAYSWWIAALDDRIKCAVPVAGITSLRNHVVDGCVEGHCDCMYMVNTYRWDYATVAALVAPRPLLISNTDKDSIFPLDGVVHVHQQVAHIYDLYNQPQHHGLHITEGPHKDTQELRVHAFRWFNRWLKQDEGLIETAATKFFEPEQLKVFSAPPNDQENTVIDETFVPASFGVRGTDGGTAAVDRVLADPEQWRQQMVSQLRRQCFAAWPDSQQHWKPDNSIRLERLPVARDGVYTVSRIHFQSQQHVNLFVDVVVRNVDRGAPADHSLSEIQQLELFYADQQHWDDYAFQIFNTEGSATDSQKAFDAYLHKHTAGQGHAVAVFAPRGIGSHAYVGDKKKLTQIERRYQLIGTTCDTMRIWDLRRALQIVRSQIKSGAKLALAESGTHGGTVLLASLFEEPVDAVRIHRLTEHTPPSFAVLNLRKVMDTNQIPPALAALRVPVLLQHVERTSLPFVDQLTSDKRWPGKAVQFAAP